MQKRIVRRMVIGLIAAICVVGWFSCAGAEETAFGIGLLKHRTVNGSDYVEKKSITPILILGIDRQSTEMRDIPRNNGQADFILLMVIDHSDKVIRQLMIDRDTMLDIPVTDVFGIRSGSRNMQLCLAHAFGRTQEDGCAFMTEAVGNLLDLKITLYYSVDMDGVGIFNDALGGVRITFPEDYSDIDPVMQKGATVVLDSAQASAFVRSRMNVGDGTNSSRMKRQQIYISSAMDTLNNRLRGESLHIGALLDALDNVASTNASRGRLLNEASRAICYDILPAETFAGEYKTGEDGFKEFYADREAVDAWIAANLYEPNC